MELKEILEKLLEQGKLTRQDIIDVTGTTETMKKLTDMLHLLLCHKDHDTECNYIKEDLFDESWEAEDHAKWLERVRVFLEELKADEVTGLRVTAAAVNVIRDHPAPVLQIIAEYVNSCQVHALEQSESSVSENDLETSQNENQDA